MTQPSRTRKVASGKPESAPIGLIATTLADAVASKSALFVATDEQRALSIAAAVQAAAPDAVVVHLPSSDALPGDRAPPSPANAGHRAAAFRRLRQAGRTPVCLVTTVEAATHLYPSPSAFDAVPPQYQVGDAFDDAGMARTLEEIGYRHVDRVDEPGDMAVRGHVVDLFPVDADTPCRIEAEDGTIVAIRTFDPVTQLGTGEREALDVGRVQEPPLGDTPCDIFAHLPDAAHFADLDLTVRRARFLALVADATRGDAPVLPVLDDAAWAVFCDRATGIAPASNASVPHFAEGKAPVRAFASWARGLMADGCRLLLVGGARDLRFLRRRVARILSVEPLAVASWSAARTSDAELTTLEMPVDRGWRADGLAIVAATDLLGSRAVFEEHAAVSGFPASDAGALAPGDVVVHEDFGIGVIAGLEALPAGPAGDAGDAIILDYADGGRRLVPVAEADRIWRYGADRDAVTLDRLDGSSWLKRRGAIDEAIAQSARDLALLAAERADRTAPVIEPPSDAYERFAAAFAFTETPDQTRAINAVRADLGSGRPMDRLVIGDVGYGKTEVALRAAALAVLAGKQVAIAAPTTVLVRQHLALFTKRFADIGVTVAGLSRLSSAAEKTAVRKGLADGSIAIVIGTVAVAAKGVDYRELGLVIVDEEQRFGAADKTRLRALGAEHVLTLSATPIPRTLQAALVGLQQMSVIATPPARRQPVRTSVATFDDAVVRTALLRERGRGGQSFVVVARIQDMADMGERLARLVPDLEIVAAHGKMPAAEIDEAMVRFSGGEGDVLLATNIIEAGLDVPRANTMVVWHADRFGLSQLHQLRGRVGRGGRRGQLLLTTAPDANIAETTLKRLRTLQALDTLGAGFAISARDLDMRGAGDLLGDAQAGHMKLIGVDLYQHLLAAGLRRARGEDADRWTPDLHLGIAGCLPEDWISDMSVRLALYARLARVGSTVELDGFEDELEDRFGAMPDDAATLLRIAAVRLLAHDAGVARIDAGPGAIAFTFHGTVPASAAAMGFAKKKDRYLLAEAIPGAAARLARLGELLETMRHATDAD